MKSLGMSTCCDLSYQTEFDVKNAQEELDNYRRNELKKSTHSLLKAIKRLPLQGKTLLDIGGGIGVLPLELFREGIQKARHIEISAASRQAFLSEARRQAKLDKIASSQGDFLDLHDTIKVADLVTLDKVICCYENYPDLVTHSLSKARKWYAYSIPRDVWWVRFVHRVEQWVKRRRGKTFRSYIHPAAEIERIVRTAGFDKIEQHYQREWLIVVFERSESA